MCASFWFPILLFFFFLALDALGIDRNDLGQLLTDTFSEQICLYGFVHSDPHPGNLFVRPVRRDRVATPVKANVNSFDSWKEVIQRRNTNPVSGVQSEPDTPSSNPAPLLRSSGNLTYQLVMLDHGLCRELDQEVRLNYCHLWRAMVLCEPKKIRYYARQLGAGDFPEVFEMMIAQRAPRSSDVGFQEKLSLRDLHAFRNQMMYIGGVMCVCVCVCVCVRACV
jgi:predicted unusual protein kinase regulating ubiquinone biosynthesis (AarF/ABC1/UbiB family)